jgi:YCII-related domain
LCFPFVLETTIYMLYKGGSDAVHAADSSRHHPDTTVRGVGAPFGGREGGGLRCVQGDQETPGVSPGQQMQPPETATTVRVKDGKTLTTDGPFVETKEALGGYLFFEADDIDAAIELAARIPAARMGGAIEVRPIVEW